MPRSKRNKVISLTQTSKKDKDFKNGLVEKIQDSLKSFNNVFLINVKNQRNLFLKEIRNQFNDSKFYFGKNKIMKIALGRNQEEEQEPNLHLIAERLNGPTVGLMFTNTPREEIETYFKAYSPKDHARAGSRATMDVLIPQGPLMRHGMNMPNNMEPQLRKLGMPTELKQGVLCLRSDYTICKTGTLLNADQAHLLKHFGYELSEFKVEVVALWNRDGSTYESFIDEIDQQEGDQEDITLE